MYLIVYSVCCGASKLGRRVRAYIGVVKANFKGAERERQRERLVHAKNRS